MNGWSHRRRVAGFTLIELLIVVAIIAILAAIAVPNFLEAQVRAKLSKAKSDQRSLATGIETYMVDYGAVFPDGNDPGVKVTSWEIENGQSADHVPTEKGSVYGLFLRTYQSWKPLTTPVAYMTSIPIDAFSRVLPYGYETWWNDKSGEPYFVLLTSLGPDRDMDSGYDAPNSFYDSTNGTKSAGDVFRLAAVKKPDMVKHFFGIDFDFSPH